MVPHTHRTQGSSQARARPNPRGVCMWQAQEEGLTPSSHPGQARTRHPPASSQARPATHRLCLCRNAFLIVRWNHSNRCSTKVHFPPGISECFLPYVCHRQA